MEEQLLDPESLDSYDQNKVDTSTSELCKICFEENNTMIKLKCNHYCCEVCKLRMKQCPWCRAPFNEKINKPKLQNLDNNQCQKTTQFLCFISAVFCILYNIYVYKN